MVFSGLVFLYLFLPCILLLYFLWRNTVYRNWVLIASSFFFYAWGEPVWVVLLLLSSLIGWIAATAIGKYRGNWKSKLFLILTIAQQLAVLAYFKYIGFFIENIRFITGWNIPYQEIALPIGISFYTFQIISYLVDVYRGDLKSQSLTKVLLYVSLFPQLVAGPIVRFTDIEHEMDNRTFSAAGFSQGINRFVIGLGKKVIFANQAGEAASLLLDGDLSELSVVSAWFGIALFALQIYFDFSGYSDMAVGLGKMFGFTYPENFNYPYVSRTAGEFWRRWNISLGSFFRDYIYIPLGGNRRRMVRNLFVVWFLTGFWHGASWNFILWGLFFGLLIWIERLFLKKLLERLPVMISHVYMAAVILLGWVLFYFVDLSRGLDFTAVLFGAASNTVFDLQTSIFIKDHLILFLAGLIASTPLWRIVTEKLRRQSSWRGTVYVQIAVPAANALLLVIATILLAGESYNPFLYFRF